MISYLPGCTTPRVEEPLRAARPTPNGYRSWGPRVVPLQVEDPVSDPTISGVYPDNCGQLQERVDRPLMVAPISCVAVEPDPAQPCRGGRLGVYLKPVADIGDKSGLRPQTCAGTAVSLRQRFGHPKPIGGHDDFEVVEEPRPAQLVLLLSLATITQHRDTQPSQRRQAGQHVLVGTPPGLVVPLVVLKDGIQRALVHPLSPDAKRWQELAQPTPALLLKRDLTAAKGCKVTLGDLIPPLDKTTLAVLRARQAGVDQPAHHPDTASPVMINKSSVEVEHNDFHHAHPPDATDPSGDLNALAALCRRRQRIDNRHELS